MTIGQLRRVMKALIALTGFELMMRFRGILVSDEEQLKHADFQQTHDEWYYKMYFELLKIAISPRANGH
jgi:hypothetical protein